MKNERDKFGRFKKGRKYTMEEKALHSESIKMLYKIGRMKPYNKAGKCSKELRLKISLALKGKKKKPFSEEHKKKIRDNVLKLWRNTDYRKNMTKKHSGYKQSAETIEKRVVQLRGSKNWNWRGGITPLVRSVRNLPEMKRWSRTCLKRDGFKCVNCNKTGRLHIDHIKPFSLIMKENKIKSIEDSKQCLELWDIKNGRTLCPVCHKNIGNRVLREGYNDKIQIFGR
jgi:5-methylcytosine-specific restriction endonuclease McrA